LQRQRDEDIERLKKDADSRVDDLKKEYRVVTDELRQLVADKNSEI
jgi:hypothetical protein